MKHIHDVIVQPLLTEKSSILRESQGIYCFKVHPKANKIEIARAIEKLFAKDKIKVSEVRTSRMRGKTKRMGRFAGRRPDWKRAWVKLAAGSKDLEFFEAS